MDLFHKRIETAMQKARQIGAKNIRVVYQGGKSVFLPAEYAIKAVCNDRANEIKRVEVGAGNGMLADLLNDIIQE